MVLTEVKSEKLCLRFSRSAQNTLQMAAAASSQKITEFVLESALKRAQEILPDRQTFNLSDEQWATFQSAFDAPPRDLSNMVKLLREPSVFETGF